MKAEELMIRDWVRIKITQHNTTVTNIDANSVYTEAVFPVRYDEIEPVPLTSEILEKNGLTKHAYGFSFQYLKLNGNLRNDDTVYFTITISGKDITIDYVHQLQHALRLCGIEKEITL